MESLSGFRIVTATTLATAARDETIDLKTSSADAFALSLDETKSRIDTVAAGHEVILVGDTPADGERLAELLSRNIRSPRRTFAFGGRRSQRWIPISRCRGPGIDRALSCFIAARFAEAEAAHGASQSAA